MGDQIVIERAGRSWAVKSDGFFGFTGTREEAAIVATDLAEWISRQGRKPALAVAKPRPFIDPGA